MNTIKIITLISLVSLIIGTLGRGLIANKLTNYRLKKLDEKVDKHNKVV